MAFLVFSTCGSHHQPVSILTVKRSLLTPGANSGHPLISYTIPPLLCHHHHLHKHFLLFTLNTHTHAMTYNASSTTKMQIPTAPIIIILTLLHILTTVSSTTCRTSCNDIPINYPFGVDDGCGAPQYRHMFNCSTSLFFTTPSGNYKVQSIDYKSKTMVIYDPSMSTCSILQPHHDFIMTDIQSAMMPPAPDTVFALVNCSIDSPVLNHYKNLCFNFSGHSCDELYGACNAFRIFHLVSNTTAPPCCFTGYDTVKYMSMNILDCTHYTTVINTDSLKGLGPSDWVYGIRLSFSMPDTGCERCTQSGGTCGFDTETEGMMCLCSSYLNSTRECAPGTGSYEGGGQASTTFSRAVFWFMGAFLHMSL